MPLYVCRVWGGEPQALEHLALTWVAPEDLMPDKYPMPPADIPLVYQIRDRL
jgi:8-oxo-dGTP diphosphatase